MEILEGIIELDFPLIVQSVALEAEYNSALGGHEIRIYFPHLPFSPEGSLLPPEKCSAKAPDPWGSVIDYSPSTYPDGNISVAINKLYFQCNTSDFDVSCEKLQLDIDRWRLRLYSVLCLEKKRDYGYSGHSNIPGQGIHLFRATPEFHRYNISLPGTIEVVMHSFEYSLSQTQLSELFVSADLSQNLKLEYDLLARAYQEIGKREYRFALIQALSAIEICLTNKLSILCDEKSIDANLLLGKKSLGDKFEMLRAFRLDWPTKNPNETITKYRNDLFHSRLISPSLKTATDVIDEIRLYLDTYSPGYF